MLQFNVVEQNAVEDRLDRITEAVHADFERRWWSEASVLARIDREWDRGPSWAVNPCPCQCGKSKSAFVAECDRCLMQRVA